MNGVPIKAGVSIKQLWRLLQWLLTPALVLLAGMVLWHRINALSPGDLRAAWATMPATTVAWSLLGTAISFACLAGYECLATRRAVPGRVPLVTAMRVGALAHAISNTLGFHALTAAAVRYHLYRRLGLGITDVARVVAMVAVCVGIGVVLVSTIALVQLQLGAVAVPRVGLTLVVTAVVLLGIALAVRARGDGASKVLPVAWRNVVGLLLLSLLEMSAAVAALYVLLPAASVPSPAQFTLIFVAATVFGIVSHAPGGIGVFEATILAALPGDQDHRVLVALLLYRAIYNLLPFVLATAVLALDALRGRAPAQSVRRRI